MRNKTQEIPQWVRVQALQALSSKFDTCPREPMGTAGSSYGGSRTSPDWIF